MAYTRYYRGQLDEQERAAYDALIEGIQNCREDISLTSFPLSSMTRVFRAINLDYPEFFYVDQHQLRMSVGISEMMAHVGYICSVSEIRRLIDGINRTADSIAADCYGKTPLEMERLIHDELIRRCRYGSLPERPQSAHNIRGALLDGICVCEGYAKAFKFLADRVKLQSLVALGMAASPGKSEEGHAWNMVKLGRHVYHLDVTFDRLICSKYHSVSYFNLSDKEIQFDHTLDSLFKMPAALQSGSLIPTVGGTRQLMDYLKGEALRGASYSEVRLTRGFPHKELMRMISDQLQKEDYWWYNRIRAYVCGDGEKSLFILWH